MNVSHSQDAFLDAYLNDRAQDLCSLRQALLKAGNLEGALKEADAILAKYRAEAEGIQQVLEGKAKGYADLVQSCNGDAKAAATLLMIERLHDIVTMQVEAVKNLKIDKVTVWDSGAGPNGASSTANFLSGLIKSLPPLHDIAKMAGLELPEYLGEMGGDKKEEKAGTGQAEKSPPAGGQS